MYNHKSINPKLLNKAEIARKSGFSREYVRLLILGRRKNKAALDKVKQIIKEQLKAA